MRNRFFTILLSFSAAIILLYGSYAKWEKELYINGNIRVVPDPAVLADMKNQLNELQMQLEEQKIFEEQQRLLVEQQKLLEQQRLLEEQGAMEQNDSSQVNETNNIISKSTENEVDDENFDNQVSKLEESNNKPEEFDKTDEELNSESKIKGNDSEEESSAGVEVQSNDSEESNKETGTSSGESSN
jgi:hypothetical protein